MRGTAQNPTMRATAFLALAWLLPAACQAPAPLPPDLAALAAEAPEDQAVRLCLEDGRVVATTVPLGPGGVPGPARITADAIAPGGVTGFTGREWSARGVGYRVEKTYEDGPAQHFRSVLVTADGAVLERTHSVPLSDVPAPVLQAALGPARSDVLRAEVVSGAEREEGWRLLARDRGGRTFVIETDLRGSVCHVARLVPARLAVRSTGG